jgi:hypothetical protein
MARCPSAFVRLPVVKKADPVAASSTPCGDGRAQSSELNQVARGGPGTDAEVKVLAAVPMFMDETWRKGASAVISTRTITCTGAARREAPPSATHVSPSVTSG